MRKKPEVNSGFFAETGEKYARTEHRYLGRKDKRKFSAK